MSEQKFTALLLNLDRDTGRLAHMTQQLQQVGVAFTRLSGVLGAALPDDLRPLFFAKEGAPKTSLTAGEIGCYASHWRAMQRIAAGEFGAVVLVMEDDLAFAPDFKGVLNEALNLLPKGWGILRLTNPARSAYLPVAWMQGGSCVARYSRIPVSTGAYVITPDAAQSFLEKGFRGSAIDDDMRRPWFHGMATYGLVPSPVKAGVLESSLEGIGGSRRVRKVSSHRERAQRGDWRFVFLRLFYMIGFLGLGGWLACGAINLISKITKPFIGRRFIDIAARLYPVRRKHA